MTYVAINVLTVPDGQGSALEQRFAKRAGMVESAAGFRSFELLRPTEGTQDYLVVTRWDDEESYRSWLESREFRAGHTQAQDRAQTADTNAARPGPAATDSQIWTFEVVQQA